MVDGGIDVFREVASTGGKSKEFRIYRDDPPWNRQMFGCDRVPNAPARVDLAWVDQSRTFLVTRFLYHFLPGERVRPVLGADFGQFIDRRTLVCQPSPCESIFPVRQDGSHPPDPGFIAGASIP